MESPSLKNLLRGLCQLLLDENKVKCFLNSRDSLTAIGSRDRVSDAMGSLTSFQFVANYELRIWPSPSSRVKETICFTVNNIIVMIATTLKDPAIAAFFCGTGMKNG